MGVGIVLTEYLRHARDADLLEASLGIEKAARYEYYGMPTISFGSTGILLYLVHRNSISPTEDGREAIRRILSALRLHS